MGSSRLACALGPSREHGELHSLSQTYTFFFNASCSSRTLYLSKIVNLPIFFVLQAVVLFAMGGYGTYLGFRIRFSDDVVNPASEL